MHKQNEKKGEESIIEFDDEFVAGLMTSLEYEICIFLSSQRANDILDGGRRVRQRPVTCCFDVGRKVLC